jgi:hypothetical protein
MILIDDNGVRYFVDDLGVTFWTDDNGAILGGGRMFTIKLV